jgi:ABC-2 type transport system ATP-binding protein
MVADIEAGMSGGVERAWRSQVRPVHGVPSGSPTGASEAADAARILGYLPQDLGVYPDLTAREFLDYIALLKGIDDRSARRRRVGELLEVVALTADADRRLRGYSGGMRRRVGIAQALLADPRLLIVDEPTAGLDPEERIRFRTLLAQLAGPRTVLLSTHIVDDIAQTCRELAVLTSGRLVFRGHAPRRRHALPRRLAGAAVSRRDALEPTLEDGYLALAQNRS